MTMRDMVDWLPAAVAVVGFVGVSTGLHRPTKRRWHLWDLLPTQQPIRRWARWLDTIRPGWEAKVNLTRLDLLNGYFCVLGQVFAEEGRACTHEYGSGYRYASDVFFDGNKTPGVFWQQSNYIAAWHREITARRSDV